MVLNCWDAVEFSHVEVFVMCCSNTLLVFIFNIFLIPKCRKTSREARRDFLRAQLSHPHSRRLQGMALNSRYFEYVSTWSSSHILDISPIEAFAAASLFVMSWSSLKEKEIHDPR